MDYLDLDLSVTAEDMALRQAAHKFAAEIMRPVAKKMDGMSAEAAIAKDSPLWDFLKAAFAQGYHCSYLPSDVGGVGLTPLQSHMVTEELGWGSFGLTVLLSVISMPFAL